MKDLKNHEKAENNTLLWCVAGNLKLKLIMKTKYVYPSTEIETVDCGVMDVTQKVYHKGMTLREYYAGVAMQGIIASTQGIGLEINEKHIETISKKSVLYADSLLKALMKT